MPRSLPRRGIIEGFYGEPWSHDARVEVIEFSAERGMNAYVYAPKDDPKHRARWRDPYDAEEHARFLELVDRCSKVGVQFGFAASPGLDLDGASPGDRAALLAKFVHLRDAGARWFVRDPLGAELAPWLRQARLEVDAALAALRLVQQLRPVARRGSDRCRVVGPDSQLTFMHAFAVLLTWSGARARTDRVVLGPRFVVHPAVVPLAGGEPGVDVDLAVREDESVVDRLCRLALDDYQRWRPDAGCEVTVETANGPISTDAVGFCSLDSEVVFVRSGSRVTRVPAAVELPFPDPRLAS